MNHLDAFIKKVIRYFENETLNSARKFKSLEAKNMYLNRLNFMGNIFSTVGLVIMAANFSFAIFTSHRLGFFLLTMMFGLLFIAIGSIVSESTINAVYKLFSEPNE